MHEISHVLVFNVNSFITGSTTATGSGVTSVGSGSDHFQRVLESIVSYPFLPVLPSVPNAITTSQVVAWAKDYYNCLTLTSFPIEVNSTTGRFRWNRVVLLDDINSGLFTEGEQYWTGINNALLQDSGWYTTTSTMHDSRIQYGYNRGCLFLTSGCTGSNYFPEFCISSGSKGINLSRTSQSVCTVLYSSDESTLKATIQTQFQGCMYYKSITTRHCQNSNNASLTYANKKLVSEFNFSFSTSSRAFSSTLTPFSYTAYDTIGCFKATCATDSKSIHISFGSTIFICKEDGSFVYPQKAFEYTGRLSCPSSISKFCNTGQICTDYCQQYGYCMNSSCTCINNRSGSGCQCTDGMIYKNGTCQVCELACAVCNESHICEKCDSGYYLEGGSCKACDTSCLTCSATTPTLCTTCDTGYFLEKTTSLCVACSSNCKTCTSETKCTKCNVGFGLDITSASCTLKCDYNCNRCSVSPVNCVECAEGFIVGTDGSCKCKNDGYFNDSNNACSACISNCIECENDQECITCGSGYQLLKYSKKCQLTHAMRQVALISVQILLILFVFIC